MPFWAETLSMHYAAHAVSCTQHFFLSVCSCCVPGLLSLLRRDSDLVAMVLAHEMAHALARHNSEKMGMGLAITMILSMLATALQPGAPQQQQQQQRKRRHNPYSRLIDEGNDEQEEEQQASSAVPAGASAAGPSDERYKHYPQIPNPYDHPSTSKSASGSPAADELPAWMSQQLLSKLTSVLLELPFSRRAETEADLIGLKLMALAGFNTRKGPEAFTLLAGAGGARRGHGAEALIAGLGCTHPDSNKRAQVLQAELEWMARNKAVAQEQVGAKLDYWSL